MTKKSCLRLYLGAGLTFAVLFTASPARAQYSPPAIGSPATGEQFVIELSGAYWYPTADISVASTSLNVVGTDVNLKNDLGLTDDRFPMFKIVLKPKAKHKIRFQYIPISYSQTAAPTRVLTFAGQTFARSVPINSTLDWKAYEFGYEYDFVSSNYMFVGAILEAKYTDVSANLTSAVVAGANSVKAPIPAVGAIARAYLAPNLSLTGELTGIKVPSIHSFSGHYADVDVYATLNLTRRIGAQAGYRAMDVSFGASDDSGSMTLKGAYIGGVLRY
ncbi:MAG: hypothetical protein LAO77_24040 [Acidobacteriia bacterium]|nr:hypothetical protein [Terriglobia bacterium]